VELVGAQGSLSTLRHHRGPTVTIPGVDSSVQMERRADVLPFQHAPEPLDLVRGREKGMVAVNRRVFALNDIVNFAGRFRGNVSDPRDV